MEPTNINPTPVVTPPPTPIEPLVPPVTPPPTMAAPVMQKEHKPIGPIIGVVIILILLVAAAIYVWGQKLNNDKKVEMQQPAVQETTPTVAQEEKDDFSDLEANLDSSVEGLDDLNF